MRGVENLVGVFDTERARIIGVAAKGTTDVSYFAAQDTPTVGMPVTAVTDPLTGGIEIIGPSGDAVIVIEAAAPDDEDGRADGVIYIQTGA